MCGAEPGDVLQVCYTNLLTHACSLQADKGTGDIISAWHLNRRVTVPLQVDILNLEPRINPSTGKTYGSNAAASWGVHPWSCPVGHCLPAVCSDCHR